jgi:hypothetical protein
MLKQNECVRPTSAKKIAVSEGARGAIFLNPENASFRVIKADGCLYKNMLAADWIVCGPPGDVIIELKGSDVNHALDQVLNTMAIWSKDPEASLFLTSLIVCSRVPRFDSKIQRAKATVAKRFKTKLHVCSRNKEHVFAELF